MSGSLLFFHLFFLEPDPDCVCHSSPLLSLSVVPFVYFSNIAFHHLFFLIEFLNLMRLNSWLFCLFLSALFFFNSEMLMRTIVSTSELFNIILFRIQGFLSALRFLSNLKSEDRFLIYSHFFSEEKKII